MDPVELIRVVALRNGKLKAAEFKLREGETGLSLFGSPFRRDPELVQGGTGLTNAERPTVREVVEAVRAAGKQGELAAALLPADFLAQLGLRLERTPGGTPVADVNAAHFEARLSWWRRAVLRLRRIPVHIYFNDEFSQRLCAMARVLD